MRGSSTHSKVVPSALQGAAGWECSGADVPQYYVLILIVISLVLFMFILYSHRHHYYWGTTQAPTDARNRRTRDHGAVRSPRRSDSEGDDMSGATRAAV